MYIMTLKMKFIQDPRLEFFEKKSSRFIIVIIYIYIIYLIGLNLCPTLCLILCPVFLMLKNIKSLIYRIMHSLNTLCFVSGFVSRFVSHFVSDKYQSWVSVSAVLHCISLYPAQSLLPQINNINYGSTKSITTL